MKKVISILLSVLIIFSAAILPASAAGNSKTKLNYLLLGDSIARGAGVLNPDEACYGIMVANTNGYNYTNRAIDGYTSTMLLKLMEKDDVIADIKKADIISLSIGGNDYLTSNIVKLFVGSDITKDTTEFLKIQASFYENLGKIISKIKHENPGVIILIQTLYNMRSDLLKNVNEIGKNMLNECFEKYLTEHPGAYMIVDVDSVLTGRSDCLASDTIHPNGQGNIEIARLVLKALKKIKLGTATEPVIITEPIEQTGFGFKYWKSVITYYVNYWMKRLAF